MKTTVYGSGIATVKCTCQTCGLVFYAYVKSDLCTKHYWEFRDFASNYVMKPEDYIKDGRKRSIVIHKKRLPSLYKQQNRK
jgi:hypothetical protein